MNLLHSFVAPAWIAGLRAEVTTCENCHRSLTLRNSSIHKAGIRMHGAWFCSSACFTFAVEREMGLLLTSRLSRSDHFSRMPLGLSLVNRGLLTNEQLKEAVQRQREAGGDIGDVLVSEGTLTEEQMTSARAAQWDCPVFSVPEHVVRTHIHIPPTLIQLYSAIPLHYVEATKLLLVGFVTRVEYGLLYAIEKIADCKTQPCFVTPSDFRSELRHRSQIQQRYGDMVGREIRFDEIRTATEMAHKLCEYSVELEADEAIIGRCKEYLWARLKTGKKDVDLLFKAA